MNRSNPGMNRFFTEACHMYGPQPGVRRWQYRVRDKDQIVPQFGAKTVLYTHDAEIAERAENMLNHTDKSTFSEIAWQGCLDHANKNAVEARAEIARLQVQLFEAREQRDDARAHGADAEKVMLKACKEIDEHKAHANAMRLTAARAQTEAAELRKALEASHRELAGARSYWAQQAPHDHVVMSLAGYERLRIERDEALAKYAACVDVVSLVDGRWVKTK